MTNITAGNGHDSTGGLEPPVTKARASKDPTAASGARCGADDDPNTVESLYPVGVTASVINRQTQVDGVLKVSVSGLQRTAIVRLINDGFLSVEVVPLKRDAANRRKLQIFRARFSMRTRSTPTSIFLLFRRGPKAVSACLRSGLLVCWPTQSLRYC